MLLLNFNFAMVYIIHENLILLKNPLNYLKYNIFECCLRIIIDFDLFFFK